MSRGDRPAPVRDPRSGRDKAGSGAAADGAFTDEWQRIRWRAEFDSLLQADRLTSDVGSAALRSAFLVNAGAGGALAALAGQLWGRDQKLAQEILVGLPAFVWGVGLAALCYCVAYLYHSAVAWITRRAIQSDASPERSQTLVRRLALVLRILLICLGLASVLAFIGGAVHVSSVFFGIAS